MTEASTHIRLPAPRGADLSVTFARFAAVLVCVIGEIVLALWLEIFPGLEDSLPSLVGMTPNAALGVIAAGLGLLCFTFRRLRLLARAIALALIAVGLAVFGQKLLGIDFGLGQLLLPPEAVAPSSITVGQSPRAGPGVVGSLVLFGFALLWAKRGRVLTAVSQILTLAMLAQVLIVAAGYAYGIAAQAYPFPFTLMSVYGAVCALLLALGLLAASPEYGVAAVIVERSPAGEMLRRLLPGILVLPLVIGWFARQAEMHALYDDAAILVLFAVASILVLALFAWATVGAVRRADQGRNVALMELRGQREWLSTTLGSIGDGVIATDPNGSVLLLNKVAEQLTGWPASQARGRPVWEVFRVIDESTRKPVDDPALRALRERDVARLESGALLITRDGKELPVEHSGAPIIGYDGTLAGAVLVFRDVTERRKTAQHQSMLVGELNHRVKNALAIVQSLVQASLRQATSEPAHAMAETLAHRLQALHRAHDLLLESQWSGASLKGMVERELDPYRREDGPNIAIKGPDVLLPPQCTSILAMTLHELATNAMKYGALAQSKGQLSVTWKMARGNRLLLVWEERGTPSIPQRRSSGFGMQLINKGIRHNLGGETKVEFRPAGIYVELNIPLTPSNEPRMKRLPAQAPAA